MTLAASVATRSPARSRSSAVASVTAGAALVALASQLAAPSWKLQSGRILVEPKDAIKKRLGRSPDDADALLLAYAPVDHSTAAPHVSTMNYDLPVGFAGSIDYGSVTDVA